MGNHQAQTEGSRKLVQSMYDASAAGDYQGFLNCFDENVVLFEPAFLPYGGRYQGVANFQAIFGEAIKCMDLATLKIESMMADGDVVVTFIRVKTINHDSDVEVIERATVREGKIVEMKVGFHEVGTMSSIFK